MLTALGYTIPLAFASGLNIYATVAVLGLCSHYGLVALPPQFRAFDHPIVITVALVMYLVEFVADKFRGSTRCGIAVHTVVRRRRRARRRDRARRGVADRDDAARCSADRSR